jgi:molecular chaperone GrpE
VNYIHKPEVTVKEERKIPLNQDDISEEAENETGTIAEDDIESLKSILEEEKAKAEKYVANWQRAEADFANYKRRIEQEREENAKLANMHLILELLPVIDDFERAFDSLNNEDIEGKWLDGIKLIHRKLKGVLEAQGLSGIEAVGKEFDPSVHEAVTQAEGDEGKVVDEIRKGYKLGERVIRPSMVVVGKGKEKKEE